MKLKPKKQLLIVPEKSVLASEPFQNRLRMGLREFKDFYELSRRDLHRLIPQAIWEFDGVIEFLDGRPYPRKQAFNLIGHESGKAISNFLAFKNGAPRYTPRSETVPRLLMFYLFIAIHWPEVAKDIIK